MYFFLLSYPLLGAGLKYIDDAFDEKKFNKTLAIAIAPLLGILWVYTMLIDQFSATILFAILLGVALRGKIDNHAHLLGTIVIVVIMLAIGINFMLLPLIFLAAAAFLDELGNDVVDYYPSEKEPPTFTRRSINYFFHQRWLTKIGVLYVVLLGIFPVYFFFAMLLFDIAYFSVRIYGNTQKKKQFVHNFKKTIKDYQF